MNDDARPTLLQAVQLLVEALDSGDQRRFSAAMQERYDTHGHPVVGFVDRAWQTPT